MIILYTITDYRNKIIHSDCPLDWTNRGGAGPTPMADLRAINIDDRILIFGMDI